VGRPATVGFDADLRRSPAEVERTRDAIVRAAAALAAVDGLESLSIGGVAAAVGLSKSGVGAYFGSKTELQLATVVESARIFAAEVVQPALAAPPGLAQLTTACEAFLAHLERFPGGSFMASAGLELGTRPGPVNELLSRYQAEFGELLRGFAATALAQGELGGGEDPERLAFELNGIILAADTNFVSHDDPAVLTLARQILRQRLRPAAGSPGDG
jgi:AcrR family transcriptional regulator